MDEPYLADGDGGPALSGPTGRNCEGTAAAWQEDVFEGIGRWLLCQGKSTSEALLEMGEEAGTKQSSVFVRLLVKEERG